MKGNKLFKKIKSDPTSFEIDFDFVVIGHFQNAIEGALRWNASMKSDFAESFSPDDMCISVEPGKWHIMHIVDAEDSRAEGVFLWHEELYLDMEALIKRTIKLESYLPHEISIDVGRILGDALVTKYIGSYGWGSLRTLEQDKDSVFLEKHITNDFQQNDILLSHKNQYLLPNCHCFFCSAKSIFGQFYSQS